MDTIKITFNITENLMQISLNLTRVFEIVINMPSQWRIKDFQWESYGHFKQKLHGIEKNLDPGGEGVVGEFP